METAGEFGLRGIIRREGANLPEQIGHPCSGAAIELQIPGPAAEQVAVLADQGFLPC